MTFIIVSSVDEYRAGQGIKFQPFYVHQFFRESNEIYGYKDLTIKVYVTGVKLIPYIEVLLIYILILDQVYRINWGCWRFGGGSQ